MPVTKTIVVDLDGTICDARHRQHLAQAKEWESFHCKLAEDNPWPDVPWLLKLLPMETNVVGLTGRPDNYRSLTMDWLMRHDILLDHLLMRPAGNFDPDIVIKPRMLFDFFGTEEKARREVAMILEDRDVVVDRWRELGFNCWQVRASGY
jgi:hypothetical protein